MSDREHIVVCFKIATCIILSALFLCTAVILLYASTIPWYVTVWPASTFVLCSIWGLVAANIHYKKHFDEERLSHG